MRIDFEPYVVTAFCFGYEWDAGITRKFGFGVVRDSSGVGFRFGPFFFMKWR